MTPSKTQGSTKRVTWRSGDLPRCSATSEGDEVKNDIDYLVMLAILIWAWIVILALSWVFWTAWKGP